MAAKSKISHPAEAAFRWLVNSGIQISHEDRAMDGGVAAWFDLTRQAYPFIYAEITGYAVCAYLFHHAETGDDRSLRAACRAADWLSHNRYEDNGLVRTRYNLSSDQKPYFDEWVFTFDQWVMVYGLANLYSVGRSKVYLTQAVDMADFLLKRTVREDGLFYPLYDVIRKMPHATDDKWSRQSGSFHAKALMALAKLHELTGESRYRSAADRLAQKTLLLQQADGRFITQSNTGTTHAHPHIYTLEGLLSYGLSENRKDLVLAAEKGIRWLLKFQKEDGAIPCFYQTDGCQPYVRADVMAQALRLSALLAARGYLKEFAEPLKRLRARLLSYQIPDGPQGGGFRYGQEETGQEHEHVNAWVTMFAGQALWLDDCRVNRSKLPEMSFFA